MIGSYTYLDMDIEDGVIGTEGNQLSATPHHQASLRALYDIGDGAFSGLGLGGGLRYVGESWGDDANTIRNDDRIVADLAATYDFSALGRDGLKVNVRNAFDEDGQTCSAGYYYSYEGRTATASLRMRF